jgi:hypothetical protein
VDERNRIQPQRAIRQTDEEFSALINEAREKLLHIGKSHSYAEIFRYQDDSCEISVIATRYENYHGPLLFDDGELLTNTWTVNLRNKMIAPKANVIVSDEMSRRIKSNIESALLSRPLWPSNYGRPGSADGVGGFRFDQLVRADFDRTDPYAVIARLDRAIQQSRSVVTGSPGQAG